MIVAVCHGQLQQSKQANKHWKARKWSGLYTGAFTFKLSHFIGDLYGISWQNSKSLRDKGLVAKRELSKKKTTLNIALSVKAGAAFLWAFIIAYEAFMYERLRWTLILIFYS